MNGSNHGSNLMYGAIDPAMIHIISFTCTCTDAVNLLYIKPLQGSRMRGNTKAFDIMGLGEIDKSTQDEEGSRGCGYVTNLGAFRLKYV